MICEICGKELVNPNHPSHINSRFHQEALLQKRVDEARKANLEKLEEFDVIKKEKDPGDLNILVSHVERCGVSWFCTLLSLVYEQMYGKIHKWSVRTSRLMAGHPEYPIQKGWNTARYVSIQDIAKKPFDKIILLQRQLEPLKRSIFLYRYPNRDYDEAKNDFDILAWHEKFNNAYKRVYGPIPDADKVLRVYIEDMNNYTVATFNEILDFLGFPRKGRPVIIPVNPSERNWQVFSSILAKKQRISQRLQDIYYRENKDNTKLEFIKQGNEDKTGIITYFDVLSHDYKLLPEERLRSKETSEKFGKKVKDIITAFPELEIDDPLEFIKRAKKVLIIGSIGQGLGCHFSEHAVREFRKMGIKALFLPIPEIIKKMKINLLDYHVKNVPRKLFSLQKIIDFFKIEDVNLIFIDGSRFCINNDTENTCFYNHRGWHLPFVNENMDVTFLVNENYLKIRKRAGVECEMHDLPPSVDLETFYPKKKEITEVVGIGYRRPYSSWRNIVKYYEGYSSLVDLTEVENEIFKRCGYKYFETPISDLKYRELLRKIKIFWFSIPNGQYVTRRMVEAMACKTLCIFRLEDKNHEGYLKKLGFINMKHYVGLNSFEDIIEIDKILEKVDIDEMIEKAYKLVTKKHTHLSRAKKIIEIFNNIKTQEEQEDEKEEYNKEKMIEMINEEERYDVIVPMYHIRDDLEYFIDNWFKELPIRKLFLGYGKDKRDLAWGGELVKEKIKNKYGDRIVKIDQTHFKTQGMCMADLMKRVETKWFIYLHQDAYITPHAFEVMKKYMKNDNVGCIEGGPIIIRHEGKKLVRLYPSRQYTYRGYSGFQVFRTETIKDFLNTVEDDYIYRNEDIIFQNVVLKANYSYEKSWAMFLHYNEIYYKSNEKDAYEMILGLIKYTKPLTELCSILNRVIRFYYINFGINPPEKIIEFIKKNNIEWLRILEPILDEYKR